MSYLKSSNQIKNNNAWLYRNLWNFFLFSAFAFLILGLLIQKGTFLDGMLYKAVAYNYGEGLSTFWVMKFTNTRMSFFCDQPPLYFFLLGNFYKLFGTNYLTDRAFTLLLFVVLFYLIGLISKELFKKPFYYLAFILFLSLSVPVFCWSYVNQVIEPLVCVFTTTAILLFIKYLKNKKNIFFLLFTVNLCLLFLSKGFQSCFIVALPAVYFLIIKSSRQILYFAMASMVPLLLLLFLTLRYYEPGANWFNCYYDVRLLLTMKNVGNSTDNHFEIIGRFFSEILGCLIIMFILFLFITTRKKYPLRFIIKNFTANRLALSLLITSFVGSFPYALSLVQRGFYLLPAFVCFFISVAYGFRRYWTYFFGFLSNIARYKIIQFLIIILWLASLFYIAKSWNSYKRDEDMLSDLQIILPHLQSKDTLLINEELWSFIGLQAYLYMDKQINLSLESNHSQFMLRLKNNTGDTLKNAGYVSSGLATKTLELLKSPKNKVPK